MEMPAVVAVKKRKAGRPKSAVRFDRVFQLRLDKPLSAGIRRMRQRESLTTDAELIRKLLRERLRQENLLD